MFLDVLRFLTGSPLGGSVKVAVLGAWRGCHNPSAFENHVQGQLGGQTAGPSSVQGWGCLSGVRVGRSDQMGGLLGALQGLWLHIRVHKTFRDSQKWFNFL